MIYIILGAPSVLSLARVSDRLAFYRRLAQYTHQTLMLKCPANQPNMFRGLATPQTKGRYLHLLQVSLSASVRMQR